MLGRILTPVPGKWTVVSGNVYGCTKDAEVPAYNPEGEVVDVEVLTGHVTIDGVHNILTNEQSDAPTVYWRARCYTLPPVNEDAFGSASRYITCVDIHLPEKIDYTYNTQVRLQVMVDAVNATQRALWRRLGSCCWTCWNIRFEGRSG